MLHSRNGASVREDRWDAWKACSRRGAQILTGRTPNLSIEITRECPLRCPGCYAYGDDHLGGDVTLREVADYKGEALVHAQCCA